MVLCLGEPLRSYFFHFDVHFISFCCYFCVFILLMLFFFHFQSTFPCHQHSTLASQNREGLHQIWAIPRLLSIAFAFASTARATALSGRFLPTGVFYLMLLHRHLAQPAFIKASLRAGSSSLKFAELHYPAHLFVWIRVNSQASYSRQFSFTAYLYNREVICGA